MQLILFFIDNAFYFDTENSFTEKNVQYCMAVNYSIHVDLYACIKVGFFVGGQSLGLPKMARTQKTTSLVCFFPPWRPTLHTTAVLSVW